MCQGSFFSLRPFPLVPFENRYYPFLFDLITAFCLDNSNIPMSSSPARKSSRAHTSKSSSEYTIFGTSALVAVLLISFASLYFFLPFSGDYTCSKHAYNATPYGFARINSDGDTIHRIVVVTDLDHDSKHPSKKNTWRSFMKRGELLISRDKKIASVAWDEDHGVELTSQISAGGRSMELSDLIVYDGHLLTVDDRTGIVYKVVRSHKRHAFRSKTSKTWFRGSC